MDHSNGERHVTPPEFRRNPHSNWPSDDGNHHFNRRNHHQNLNFEQNFSRKRPSDQAISQDGCGFVKLYVVGVPRSAEVDEVWSVFAEHGHIIEVVRLKDKITGLRKECCFVKYRTLDEADRAIGEFNGRFTFPGGDQPLEIKFADGELDRLGIGEHTRKLYVCGLRRQASSTEVEHVCSTDMCFKPRHIESIFPFAPSFFNVIVCSLGTVIVTPTEVEHVCSFLLLYLPSVLFLSGGSIGNNFSTSHKVGVFSPYGVVEDVFFVHDQQKQRRGCAFVRFARRDMAIAAMNALHGTYIEKVCDHSLIVRFADPKKPRVGDSRVPSHTSEQFNGNMAAKQTNHHSPNQTPNNRGHPQTVSSTFVGSDHVLPSGASAVNARSLNASMVESIDCEWSEHICPDGFLYYYNCVTCESRWEMPEEFALYEKKLEKLDLQQQDQHNLRLPVHAH